jgi:hypothetical protein
VGERSGGDCHASPSARLGHGRRRGSLVALSTLVWSSLSAAQDEAAITSDAPVEIHGFVSQGFILGFGNEFLARSKSGSVEFSEAGLNFTKQLTPELRTGLELFVHDLGPFGNFQPEVDWYYLDYRYWDWLGVRVGRIKVPFGLYNELNDIDVARVPILLPQSIYQADHREYLFAQTGGEVYGDVRLGPAGSLEYRAYGGTLPDEVEGGTQPPPGITVTDVRVPYLYGGRLLWETPLEGLTAGASGQAVRFDADYVLDPAVVAALQAAQLLPADQTPNLPVKFRVTRWIASLQYAAYDLDVSAEYSRWIGEFYSRAPALFVPHIVNERYYLMASYRMDWFTPGIYYSGYFQNVEQREGKENYTHDIAVTTRFDLNAHWLLKLEGHYARGTAGLDNMSLNGGRDRADLEPTWGALLIKTTAYY